MESYKLGWALFTTFHHFRHIVEETQYKLYMHLACACNITLANLINVQFFPWQLSCLLHILSDNAKMQFVATQQFLSCNAMQSVMYHASASLSLTLIKCAEED